MKKKAPGMPRGPLSKTNSEYSQGDYGSYPGRAGAAGP
jgi:hypothetical protein